MSRRPDAARNARAPKVNIVHGGNSRKALTAPLDGRTAAGRLHASIVAGLVAHVGGEPTLPERELIEQAARLGVVVRMAFAELIDGGRLTTDHGVAPALDAYLRAARDQRALLESLGLARRAKDVPTLSEVLGDG